MSERQARNNTGALFMARHKRTAKHPDVEGRITVAGIEYSVSGWSKLTKDGAKFLALSLRAAETRPHKTDGETAPDFWM